jgi:hypothetical protein
MFLSGVEARVFLCNVLAFWAGHFACGDAIAQEKGTVAIEILASRDASGTTYLPHEGAFEVRLSNLSDQPISIWNDRCLLGHPA